MMLAVWICSDTRSESLDTRLFLLPLSKCIVGVSCHDPSSWKMSLDDLCCSALQGWSLTVPAARPSDSSCRRQRVPRQRAGRSHLPRATHAQAGVCLERGTKECALWHCESLTFTEIRPWCTRNRGNRHGAWLENSGTLVCLQLRVGREEVNKQPLHRSDRIFCGVLASAASEHASIRDDSPDQPDLWKDLPEAIPKIKFYRQPEAKPPHHRAARHHQVERSRKKM